jgi:predicted transcriptional regulator
VIDLVGLVLQNLVHAMAMARKRKSLEEALQNPIRRTLIDKILRRPGQRIVDLHDDQPRGTIHYHLQLLERVGALQSLHESGVTRYFLPDMDQREVRRLSLLLRGRALEFARAVVEAPGIAQDVLVRTRRLSRKVLQDYVPRMVEQGLLTIEPAGKTKHYHPTDELRRLVQRLGQAQPPGTKGQPK